MKKNRNFVVSPTVVNVACLMSSTTIFASQVIMISDLDFLVAPKFAIAEIATRMFPLLLLRQLHFYDIFHNLSNLICFFLHCAERVVTFVIFPLARDIIQNCTEFALFGVDLRQFSLLARGAHITTSACPFVHSGLRYFPVVPPTVVYQDNTAAIALSTGAPKHKRSKHFGIEFDVQGVCTNGGNENSAYVNRRLDC